MIAKLIHSAVASADGYIEDPGGSIDWGMPDEELLGFINELEQPARTYLYGRRMYEAMLYWETAHTMVQPRLFQEFTGIWQAAEKIVFSKTLASVSNARTRVEPAFEPGLVRPLKSAAEHDMRVGAWTWPDRPSRPSWPTRCGYSWFLLSSEVASERFPTASAQIWSYWIRRVRQRCCLPQVLPPVSLRDGADLGDPGLEHPACAGRRDVPTGLARGSGWETATGPAPGHAQPGRSDRRLTPASRKGAGVCLRPSQAVRTIPVAR